MKKIIVCVLISIFILSCGSNKSAESINGENENSIISKIVKRAMEFLEKSECNTERISNENQ